MALLLVVARIAFVGLLLSFFFTFFGIPALQRYLENGVLLKVSTMSNPSGGLLPPTITICPFTPNRAYEGGWKNYSGEYTNVLRAECDKLDDHQDVLNCVENKTYNFTETVKNAFVGVVDTKNLMDSSYWSKYMAVTAYGTCHVLKYEQPFVTDFEKSSLFLFLNPDLEYNIYYHDPKYFFTTHNLLTIPQIMIRKPRANARMDFYPLVITERKNINRPKKPCVEDVKYDFSECLIENVAAKVGCRYPWDQRPHSKVPVCTTLDKIEEQEFVFSKLAPSERKDLIKNRENVKI